MNKNDGNGMFGSGVLLISCDALTTLKILSECFNNYILFIIDSLKTHPLGAALTWKEELNYSTS